MINIQLAIAATMHRDKISKAQLCQEAGITRPTLDAILAGSGCHSTKLIAVCEALGLELTTKDKES